MTFRVGFLPLLWLFAIALSAQAGDLDGSWLVGGQPADVLRLDIKNRKVTARQAYTGIRTGASRLHLRPDGTSDLTLMGIHLRLVQTSANTFVAWDWRGDKVVGHRVVDALATVQSALDEEIKLRGGEVWSGKQDGLWTSWADRIWITTSHWGAQDLVYVNEGGDSRIHVVETPTGEALSWFHFMGGGLGLWSPQKPPPQKVTGAWTATTKSMQSDGSSSRECLNIVGTQTGVEVATCAGHVVEAELVRVDKAIVVGIQDDRKYRVTWAGDPISAPETLAGEWLVRGNYSNPTCFRGNRQKGTVSIVTSDATAQIEGIADCSYRAEASRAASFDLVDDFDRLHIFMLGPDRWIGWDKGVRILLAARVSKEGASNGDDLDWYPVKLGNLID